MFSEVVALRNMFRVYQTLTSSTGSHIKCRDSYWFFLSDKFIGGGDANALFNNSLNNSQAVRDSYTTPFSVQGTQAPTSLVS